MAKKITETKTESLLKDLKDKREKLQSFRFAVAGSSTTDVKEARELKRDIARILTELNRREREAVNT